MKIIKKLIGVICIAGVGCLLYFGGMAEDVSDKAAEVISSFYGVKKADAVNSVPVEVYINDSRLDLLPSSKLFMTDDLIWMADSGTISRIFECSVERMDSQTVRMEKDGESFLISQDGILTEGSDSIQVSEPTVMLKNDTVYISAETAARLFHMDFTWDESLNRIDIEGGSALAALPDSYDLRDYGRVPEARSQGNLGTCWAFASLSALESTLLPKTSETFAVDHLSLLNGFNISQNDGGDYNIALAYLASWSGPVREQDDPYGDNQTDASLMPVRHLQEAVNIAEKDYDTIKRMIMTCGAVQSSFYSDIEVANMDSEYYSAAEASYYYGGTALANHDIIIIGWDDHYDKNRFKYVPEHDGAFLCQNSWGQNFGDGGCFYISYEDTNIGRNNMVYTKVEDADNYDKIYQTDRLGWIGAIGYNEPEAYFANKYSADGIEALKAVSFYATAPETSYEIYVVREKASSQNLDSGIFLKSGFIEETGYYTVPFDGNITVSGDFAVIVKIFTEDAVHPVAIEYNGEHHEFDADLSDGEGYISYDGRYWQRAEENYACNLCLKAFTDQIE